MAAKTYAGDKIDVHFDMKKCVHARNCWLTLPDVFNPKNRPWINPDAASAEEIATMVRTCPSGAITFSRKDGGLEELPPGQNTVHLSENGPLTMRGDISLNGQGIGARATLCRCGHSKNKPFCDGAHSKAGFAASGEIDSDDPEDLEEQGGVLKVTPVKDGPLMVAGNVELCCGSGRLLAGVEKAALCRCGHSQNKPYCDGAHKAAGFTSDD